MASYTFNSLKKLFSILSFINRHPLAGKNKFAAYSKFFGWQLKQAKRRGPRICAFIEESKLLIDKSMAGATGNIYCGLLEFEEMSFVLHLLRPGDLMRDIGANVGVYTILAAKNAGAKVVAIEPIPISIQHLQNNVTLNHIENLTTLLNCGAGAENMELEFTEGLDAVNHVADPTELTKEIGLIKVQVKSLDDIFIDCVPVLLKIDVEGFEQAVIKGAKRLLHSTDLRSIIIELNGSGMRYGYSDDIIDVELVSYGFKRYSYNPFTRKLEEIEKYGKFNTIYLRDEDWANERISSANSFKIFGQSI